MVAHDRIRLTGLLRKSPANAGFFYGHDLAGRYINGRSSYAVDITAGDAGAGVAQLSLERVGWGALRSLNAPCDPHHHTPSLGGALCPHTFADASAVSTAPFPEGAVTLNTRASDAAGNEAIGTPWTFHIDRTPPQPASGLEIVTDSTATAQVTWTPGDDPRLADGSPGSGVDRQEYRYRRGTGPWTPWISTLEPGFAITNVEANDQFDVEVRSYDRVGNQSAVVAARLTALAPYTYMPNTWLASQFDRIPKRSVSYGARIFGLSTTTAPSATATIAQSPVQDCRVEAYDPLINIRYDPDPTRRRVVVGRGFNVCAAGINMNSQACLYKLHHFLIFHVWRKTRCGPVRYDRRAAYRPVEVSKICDYHGSGTWATVVEGSMFVAGERISGGVRSEHDRTFPHCN